MRKFWRSTLLWRLVIAVECAVALFGVVIAVGHFYSSYVTTRENIQNNLQLELISSVEQESRHYLLAERRLQTLVSLWRALPDGDDFSVNTQHTMFIPLIHAASNEQPDNERRRMARSLVELFGDTNQNNCEAPYIILKGDGAVFYNFNAQNRPETKTCLWGNLNRLLARPPSAGQGMQWGNAFWGGDKKLYIPLTVEDRESGVIIGMNVEVWRMPKMDNQLWQHISFAMLSRYDHRMLPLATLEKAMPADEVPSGALSSNCDVPQLFLIDGFYFVCKAFQGPPWLMLARYPVNMISIRALHDQFWSLVFTVMALLTLLLFIYWVLRKQMGRPLQHLVNAVGHSGLLNDHVKLAEDRSDELGHIARGYNQLLNKLKASYQTLEIRVQERTLVLDEAKRSAELISTRKSDHIANISHEIRTPMNGVVGALELLQSTPLTQQQRELVEVARSSSEHLLGIINNLIDFRHMETGQLELSYETTELLSLLDSVVLTVHLSAQRKGIALSVLVMEEVPVRMLMSRLRLKQILINLLGNAVKFTEQGSVALRVSCRENQLVIEVEDTGPGITPDKCRNIFRPFVQVNAYSDGNGLGLTIASMLARLMGGVIKLSSKVGEGTCFTLQLPLQSPDGTLRQFYGTVKAPARLHPQLQQWGIVPKEGKNRRLASSELTYLPGRLQQHLHKIFHHQNIPEYDNSSAPLFCPWSLKVLVVDDVATNRDIMRRILDGLGHRTELADSGSEALSRGCKVIYDMVLMDLRMPAMDGFETARRWRDIDSGLLDNDTPIIALTADVVSLTQRDIQAYQMQGYLIKPLKMKKVHQIIEKVIRLQLERGMELQPNKMFQKPLLDITDDKLQMQLRTTFLMFGKQINHAWEHGQNQELSESLHALKGCAGLGGVEIIYHLSEQVESRLNAGDWPREQEIGLLLHRLKHWPDISG